MSDNLASGTSDGPHPGGIHDDESPVPGGQVAGEAGQVSGEPQADDPLVESDLGADTRSEAGGDAGGGSKEEPDDGAG